MLKNSGINYFFKDFAQNLLMASDLNPINLTYWAYARNFLLNMGSQNAQAKYRFDAKALGLNAFCL